MLRLTRSSSLCLTVLLALTAMTFRPSSHTLLLLHYTSLEQSFTIGYYIQPRLFDVSRLSLALLTVKILSATKTYTCDIICFFIATLLPPRNDELPLLSVCLSLRYASFVIVVQILCCNICRRRLRFYKYGCRNLSRMVFLRTQLFS